MTRKSKSFSFFESVTVTRDVICFAVIKASLPVTKAYCQGAGPVGVKETKNPLFLFWTEPTNVYCAELSISASLGDLAKLGPKEIKTWAIGYGAAFKKAVVTQSAAPSGLDSSETS